MQEQLPRYPDEAVRVLDPRFARYVNPFAALIPLLAPSNVGESPCAQMFASMRALPSAPPPGVTKPPVRKTGE